MESKELRPLQKDLIDCLEENGAMNRNEIVSLLKIPRTTIYDNLSDLIERNMVKKFSRQVNSRGRPVVFFKIKEE
ncbi:MAG: hypothetical protein GF364_05150 [Candidatus Lokiarchaeota archaeon]|nr:hypothetical protein [Candidatus Lokiarchaeota archaeon]